MFLGVDRLEELVLVRHDERTGTTLLQPKALSEQRTFRLVSELDAERAEIFLSRAVLLVEGRTEKLVFPFIFQALGLDADQEAIAVIDCAGKGNIPLFAEICNVCAIPYVVVHDRDAPRGSMPAEAERVANETILRAAGKRRTVTLDPRLRRSHGLARAARQACGGLEALPDRRRRRPRPAQTGGRASRRRCAARPADDARRLTTMARVPGLRKVLDWVVTIGVALLLVLVFEAEVAKPYRIPSSSMEPTLHCAKPGAWCEGRFNDRVIANRLPTASRTRSGGRSSSSTPPRTRAGSAGPSSSG